MRIAAIDIGTNSIHMVIARATGGGSFEVEDREREVVQIGRGSFRGGRLRAESIHRTVLALVRFVRLARRHQVDRILCTATAAVREARNGGDFIAAARHLAGITPRVIPAEEEGRLVYLGVKSALRLGPEPALMLDIGGGSVQLVAGDRDRLLRVTSAPLGALRLTERMHSSDPPTRRQLARLRRTVRKTLREPLATIAELEPRSAYGSSGSIHALAHIAHALETGEPVRQINGHLLPLTSLRRLARRLERMTIAEIESLPGIDARRAEIILPGAVVLVAVLEGLELDGITISDFGVREGLVTDYVASHAQDISSLDPIDDMRLRSVLHLAGKFHADLKHAEHVARLALALFDGLKPLHRLGDAERETLQFAALLHDVGAAIGYDGHPEHSYYIIRHGNLRGLSADEIERVANVARFHSKTRPRKREKSYRDLARPDRRIVRWLAALLRIAEGLERSHYQLIRSLRVTRGRGAISIRLGARRDAQLELWAGRRRADLLERLAGRPVRITLERAGQKTRRADLKALSATGSWAAADRIARQEPRAPAAVEPAVRPPSRPAQAAPAPDAGATNRAAKTAPAPARRGRIVPLRVPRRG